MKTDGGKTQGKNSPERLEKVHGQGVTLNPGTTDELSQHVQGDLNTRHGLDDTNGDDEDDGKEEAVGNDTGSGVCGPGSNTSKAKGHGNDETAKVPEFGNCCRVLLALFPRSLHRKGSSPSG